MTIGQAASVFYDIESSTIRDKEKMNAIRFIAGLVTHNSIKKDAMMKVIRWLIARMDEPQKEGLWEEYGRATPVSDCYEAAWKCSVCGFDDGFPSYKYCPECGAVMKEN